MSNCLITLLQSLPPGGGALIYGPVPLGSLRGYVYATGCGMSTALRDGYDGAAAHVFKLPWIPSADYVPLRVTYCPAVSAKLTPFVSPEQ